MKSTPGVVYPLHLEKYRERHVSRNEKSWEDNEREFYASDNRYTRILFNRLPNKALSKVIIFCIAMISGMAMGMVKSIYYGLMEAAGPAALSIYSIVYYPLSYKMLWGPIVDMFYIKKLGKCKTYLVSCGVALSIIWYITAGHTESMFSPEGVIPLTLTWFGIFNMIVLFQCAGDIFLLKISPDVTKAELSMFQDLGLVVGEFFAFNIFMPLNGLKSLNKYFFVGNPLTEPVISYKQMLIFMATMTLILSLSILLFVGERITEHHTNQVSCKKLGKVLPKFFNRPSMVKLLAYVIFLRLFRYMVNGTIYPRLNKLGLNKEDLANLDTVIFPVYFLLSYFVLKKMMVAGKLMKMNHIMITISSVLLLCKFILVKDLELNSQPSRTFWIMAIIMFIERFAIRPVYLAGFINTIAPLQIGATFVSLFMSINIACQSFPTTLGLWMLGHLTSLGVSYDAYALVPISLQLLMCGLTANYAISLDYTDKEE